MFNLQLDEDEGILLQTTEVERYGDSEDEVVEMFLTNKNIVCAVEKSRGVFSKSQIEVEKIPLENIKVLDGNVQVGKVDNYNYGVGIQIVYKSGAREHYVLASANKQIPVWVEGITNAVREMYTARASRLNEQNIKAINVQEYHSTENADENIIDKPQEEIKRRFCNKCGKELRMDAKFCDGCGHMVGQAITNMAHESKAQALTNDKAVRRVVYEGDIRKCAGCGEIINSFVANCPSCGLELRGVESSRSVYEFAMNLSKLTNKNQKVMLIRSFPIPNTKEDILEFMVLASTNIEGACESTLSYAWKAKIEQSYQKAAMLISNDDELANISNIYKSTLERIENNKQVNEKRKNVSDMLSITPNLLVIMGWLLGVFIMIPLCGVNVDNVGFNAYQLLLMLLLIVGIFIIPTFTKTELNLPRIVTAVGLVLSIIIIIPLCGKNLDNVGFNSYQFILVIDIICSCVILARMIKKKYN